MENKFETLTKEDFQLSSVNFSTKTMKSGQIARVYEANQSAEKTVVFIHGFNFFIEMYAPYINHLQKHFHVITFDLPGHGLTQEYTSYEVTVFTDFIFEMIQIFSLTDYYIAGHSMGGMLAVQCSLEDRFNGCKKVLAFTPAGVKTIETKAEKMAKNPFIKRLIAKFHSLGVKSAEKDMQIRSFQYMPKDIQKLMKETLKTIEKGNQKKTIKRMLWQVNHFPWCGHFTEQQKEHVKIIFATNDNYVDTKSSMAVFKNAEIVHTLHEIPIILPQYSIQATLDWFK
ncbi:Alpha/beta hydrolase family protein [Spironucleus salmonicida]|uniref:Alpha/beta hydrolase n=1 Tax=Spironucleus salmonicida TaxID=348837 RepID=V6LG98_9EUKA|nr:Alpha/beta hydrolase family protein [Spironucleus salmonicida]|eukprot:EST43318.1 Alpha/beta hydrolase [Spironucleus salmonicida]